MTHDELLAICDNYSFKDSVEPVKALRAVVELHKPEHFLVWGYADYMYCQGCSPGKYGSNTEYPKRYPCPTIEVIEEELG